MDDEMDVGLVDPSDADDVCEQAGGAEETAVEQPAWLIKKREFSREYARRKKRELDMAQRMAVVIYHELVRVGAYQQMPDDVKDFLCFCVRRNSSLGRRYPPTMYKMFGDNIAPGVSCTLREAMQRAYKGKNEINFLVRKWVQKHGVHIDIVPDENGCALDTRYVITGIEPRDKRSDDDVTLYDIMNANERRDFRDYESRKR